MSDPLSIAGSVAGLITISAQIVAIGKELFDKVKDAPETMEQVREEVESMQPIFHQVQLLLNGSGSGLNRGNLAMISVHNLMATLTGCVIVYSKLEKKVNEVCGFNGPMTATAVWKRAGVIADQVKWGLWRHEEILCIIEDLQRQKRSLNLMLTIITCTTTTEASEGQAKLQELCMELLQSSHAQSALLRDLISRQDEQARVLEEIRNRDGSNTSTLGGAGNPMVPSTGSRPSNNSDNASIMSKRSTLSVRSGRPSYIRDLKASRAYKRLRYFGLGIDSPSDSVLSFDSACTGNWSMLSDITLGDLSVSQIAVLNLPIGLADVSNPEPYQDRLSIETPRSPLNSQGKGSSRGRIHNAIENGNVFVIRALLAIGMDIEEVDSTGRTPLVHAIMKYQEAICGLLLEKGASVEPLKAFTTGMDLKERSELLDPLITRALDGASSVYVAVLRLLVLMALGISDGDSDGSSSRSLMGIAIDMAYELAVRAIIYLEPSVLAGVDTEGRTPLVYTAQLVLNSEIDEYGSLEDICRVILDHANIETMEKMAMTRIAVSMHDLVEKGYKAILQLLSLMNSRDSEGWTPLASAALNLNEALCEFLVAKGCRLCLDTEQKNQLKPNLSRRIHDAAKGGHKAALQLLLDMGADINEINAGGNTALLDAVLYNRLSCAKILIDKGADPTLSTDYGANVLHYAAWSSSSEMIRFFLDEVAETRKLVHIKNNAGATPLHGRGGSPLQSSVVQLEIAKMLLQAGASLAIKNSDGRTPYQCARFHGSQVLAKYLWSQLSPEQQADEIPPPSY